MQPIPPDLELMLSIDDQLEHIERLAATIRALPEYSAYFAASEALYSDPGANCRRDELPMRLYQARKGQQPLTDDFCGRESVQAFVNAEVKLSKVIADIERVLSRAVGIALCEEIDLDEGPESNELSGTLRQQAGALGEMLAQQPDIHTYRAAADALANDPYAAELDLRFETTRMRLKAQQRAMNDLRPTDVETFYALREEVLANPLIDKRDHTLEEARHYLSQVVDTLNRKLRLDFLALAKG